MDKSFLKNVTILYVEDEEGVGNLTYTFLKRLAKDVFWAKNGKDGLSIFQEHYEDKSLETIDIIVTDINMPKMNGLDMLEHISKIDHLIPSIVTTAHNDPSFLKKAINQRVRGYVSKPLNMHNLIDNILLVSEPKYLKDELEKLNKELEWKVERKTYELKSILDAQDNLILVLNEDASFEVNQTLLDFFGYKNIEDLKAEHTCFSDFFLPENNYFIATNPMTWPIDIMQREDNNRVVVMKNYNNEETIFRVNVKSFMFNTKHMVISFTDITALKNYTDELKYKSSHDTLTNLYNRQQIDEEIEKEITREDRYQHGLSLLMLDIDDFKLVNDTYGHDIGDIVLKDISKIMLHSIRVTDCAARWGGEEFMILLPETRGDESTIIAQTIRKNIENYRNTVVDHPITVSIGAAEFRANIDNKEIWIKEVDLAMYEAKKTGKNKVVKYEK